MTSLPLPMILGALPLEIRELIYEYVLPAHLQSINPIQFPDPFQHFSLHNYAIFHVNRATREDVGLYYLRTRLFEIIPAQSTLLFRQFLDSFPEECGYEAVRGIEFHEFYERMPDESVGCADLGLALRCVNLRTLSLWLSMEHKPERARVRNATPSPAQQRQAIDLLEAYQLHYLFALENLKEIKLKWFIGWRNLDDCLMWSGTADGILYDRIVFSQQLEKVVDLLRAGFEERGQSVEVKLYPQPIPVSHYSGWLDF